MVLLRESGAAGGSNVTGSWLAWLIPPLHPLFEPVHVLVRKAIHVVAYGFLGALWFRAVRGERRGWMLRWSMIAVVLAVVVASADEWHQMYVPGRTATPRDVIIDCCGASLAQLLIRKRVSDSPETSAQSS